MNLRLRLALPLLGCLALSLAAHAQNAPAAGGAQRPAPAAPSNLQVLPKDISRQDLIATMRTFEQGLGVGCEFCHEPNPGPKSGDGNPNKAKARIMITMMNDINNKYLGQLQGEHKQITCGNCHLGHQEPPPFVAPPQAERGPGGPPPAGAPAPAAR